MWKTHSGTLANGLPQKNVPTAALPFATYMLNAAMLVMRSSAALAFTSI
jgi:hypothetical protein